MITRKSKALILGSAAVIVGAGVTTAIAIPASQSQPFEVQYFESGAALTSLNHVVRGDTAYSSVYGFFMEGILSGQHAQVVDSLVNDYQSRGYKNYVPYTIHGKVQNALKNPPTKAKYMQYANTKFDNISNFDTKTGDSKIDANAETLTIIQSGTNLYAPGVTDVVEVNSQAGQKTSFRARVNPDAGWSNGDKILASDFVATIKYMLDVKTASLGAQVLYETLHLRGAKDIIKKQTDEGMSFDQAWKWAEDNDMVPVRTEGSDNRWVHYFLRDETSFISIVPYLGGAQFMPVNEKFVESVGGIKKYGQTKETILSDGPYKISSMDLDYMVTFERNQNYYAPELVLIDHPGYKVSPSTAIQLKLFEDGKLSNMDVAPELLASIYKKPKLIPLLGHGGTTPLTEGIKFSKYAADLDSDSPIANKNFRKAIMYGLERNRYASYINKSGSSPAGSIFSPRSETEVTDEDGNLYYKSLIEAKYKEYDPVTKTVGKEQLGFDGYDASTKYMAAYDSQLNHEYKDYLYNKELANHYADEYFKESGKTKATFKMDIVAAEENSFLAIKNLLEETFGGRIQVESHLVSSQVMSDEVLNGKYQSIFGSISTSVDDPWTLYSKVLVEDGYDDRDTHTPYIQSHDRNGNPVYSMQTTSRYWTIPGFSVQDAIDDINHPGADGEPLADTLSRMDMDQAEWDKIQRAVTEAQVEVKPAAGKDDQAPVYKYGVATQITKATSEKIDGFTLERTSDVKDIKTATQGSFAAVGSDEYESSTNLISPYVREDGSIGKDKIFTSKKELFNFYNDIEKLVRDSSWFVPTLTSTSSWFMERRGLRSTGNNEGMPYGYRNIYPKDNAKLIAEVEARLKDEYDVDVVLEGV